MKKRQVKKRIQGGGKRVLGMLLAASMLVQPCEGFATAKTVPEDNVPVYEYLQSDRIAKEELPEGDLIYFGTASATLPEKGSYAVKLYREGNLDKKASVGLHTIDMTAVYGEDYELAMDDVKVTGDGKSLLEKYTKGNELISPDELSELAMSSETEEAALKKFEETAAEDMLDTGTDDSIDSTEVSSLARRKEEQTGMKTRKLSQEQEEEQGIMDAVISEMAADAMSELESSSQSTITFKKGESEKTVKFNILEDDKSEGMEGFSLLLTDPQGAELYQVTSLAVSIKDDEETVHSKVSFSQGEYKADNGKAVLKIKRTGADYSICDMVLRTSGGTAEAGINYIEKNELVAFAPYEMEKEIEIDVYGSGIFNVFLSEFSACEEGKYTKASIEITGDDAAEDSKNKLRNAAKSASGTKSFDIEIKGTKYSVEYVFGEPTGKIMDESYDPPVEAGTYYFAADKAHGGIFEYGYMGGDKPTWTGCRNTDYRYYNKSGKDEWEFDTSKNEKGDYGRLDYYAPLTWDMGWAGTMAYNIPGVYYSYLIPDWFTDNGTDYGRREVTVSGTDKATNTTTKNTVNTVGHHKRNQDDGAVVNKYDSNISVYVGVYTDGHMRKSYTRFFGLCAMNRKFNISMQPTDTLKFRSGEAGSVTETTGLQVEVECGAQPKNGNTQSRDIYACQDGSIDNLVFSVEDVEVNGHTGKFAYIDGYVITVDPGKTTNKNVTLNYPADIISWLNEKVKKPEKESSISFSRKSVDAQIDKIKSNLSQVPYDAYFLQWINEKQKDVADDNTGYGYKQNLKFKPIIKYYDVTVEVESPSGDGEGTFKDEQLSKNGKYTFHLGDKINLAVNVNDPEHYEVVGYQVCTNKANMYNTITDTQELFLGELPESGVYKIRPVIRKKSNVIEVNFPNSSDSSRFSIPGLVSQTELNKLGKEYNSLKGKNILITNPEGKTTLEKIIAVPGKQYIVRVMLNDSASEGDTIYRPNIKKKTSNTTYNTQVFQFTAGTDPADNVIEVRSSSTAKSSLQKYTIEGNLVSSFKPIKADGQALKNLPLTGYSVSAGNNEQKKDKNGKVYADVSASISDTTGKFVLEGITGVTGDIIPVIISNGISSAQIVNVKLSNGIRTPDGSYKVYAENTKFTYPHDAPKVTSLKYSYDKAENLQKNGGTSPVAVHILDDMFTLDATVDTCGRDIQKAIFTVTTDDGKESTYEAAETENNPGHFKVKLPMADSIFPGSKIKVRLVDNEKLYSAAGKDENGKDIIGDDGEVITGIKSQIEYPDVDTGLSFFTEQVLVNPQYYDVTDDEAVADIPLIGKATAGTTSGKLTFDKVQWADGNGYTLQVGVNMGFGNQTVPSDKDKLKSLESFMDAVNSDKANAEEIALGKEPGSTQTGKTDLKKEKAEMSSVVEKQKSSTSGKAKQAIAAMNKKEPTWKVSTSLMLAFDFVKAPKDSEYNGDCLFTSGGVAIGGTFTFNKTFYTMIASVPAFMNLSSTLQGDLVVAYKTQKGGEVLTASAFDGFSGNLAERLESPKAQLSLMLSGKIQVGVGLLGVLSARGYVTLRWQADLGLNEDTQSGSLVGSSGGIGFDLLIFSIDIDLYNVTTGWGTLEGQTKYSFFGGLLEAGKSSKGSARKASLLNSGSDKVIKKYSKNEVMTEHQYYTGTSDMSGFGKGNGLKRATPGVVKINPILEDAAERTRPKIIPLNDDNTKKMLIFMGNNGTAGNEVATDGLNSHALFYSVDNGDGNGWSEPQPVDGDGTLDSTPDIIRGKNADGKEKVIIAWADADRAFTGQDNTKSKLSAMGISAVVYDVETGVMGEKISLIGDDEYFNLSPKLNYNDGILYCSYMKRDIASLNDDSELTDFTRSYSTMAYVAYDTANGEYITRSEDGSRIAVKDISSEVTGTAISTVMETGTSADIVTESSVYGEAAIAEADVTKTSYEQYINIYHETLDDPLVTDYQSVITEIDSDVYMLSAYTVDEDTNLSTKEDRKLFLGIYNITQDREYYPIKVADDSTSQSAPALSDIDGVVYLTWLEDGYIFHMSDVSELLEALFADEGEIVIKNDTVDGESTEVKFTIDKDLYKNSYIGSNNESYNWYKKTMEELGLEDEESYENSLYSALAENSLPSDYASFSQRDDMQTSISNYTVTSDGKDIYVFFTDFGTKDENSTGIEIYGVRYKTGGSSAASATDESGETGVNMEDSCGFEQAVQITNGNMVIDELSLYMDKNSRISAVSNYFAQYIGADGGMEYSPNQLVEIEFGTKGSMEIENNYIKLPDTYVAGETGHIEFDVINNGLLTSKGYEYSVYMVQNGTETEIASGTEEAVLGSGQTQNIVVPWEIPSDLSNAKIKVAVKETGVDDITVYEAESDIPYGSEIEFGDTDIMFAEDGSPYLYATIKNNGNAASKAYKASFCLCDAEGNVTKTYTEIEVPALASGEEKEIEIPFEFSVDDFDFLGISRFSLVIKDGGETVAETTTKYSSSKPLCAQINDGGDITLDAGSTKTLEVKTAPWNDASAEVRFYSSDSDVVFVDEKGVITGTGNGSAKVYAYYPASGLTTSVNVTVKGASSGSASSGGSSGGGGIAATATPAPSQTPEPVQTQSPEPGQGNEPGSEVPGDSTETENPGQDNGDKGETEATKKIQTGKSSVIVKAGSTAKVKFKTTAADNAVRAAAVKVSVSGNKKVTASIKGQEVVIKAAAKAVKGSKATVTLKSTNAAGKTISAKIKVFVKNSTKKLKAAGSKTFIVKKGSKKQLVLGITAENKNKASTDQIKISSKLAVLKKATIKKGKAVLVLKGKKKGKGTLTVKAGNRKVKIKIRVK